MNKKYLQIITFADMSVIGWEAANAQPPFIMSPCNETYPYLHYATYDHMDDCNSACSATAKTINLNPNQWKCYHVGGAWVGTDRSACCLAGDPWKRHTPPVRETKHR